MVAQFVLVDDYYLGNYMTVVERSQSCTLLVPVPGEFSVRSFQFLVARTLISVADIGRHHLVITDGSLVYHCHNGDTQTHA